MLGSRMLKRPSFVSRVSLLFITLLVMVSLPGIVTNAYSSVTLNWTPPTTNTDGTPLTDLAGYKLYYGTSSGNYGSPIDVNNVTTYTISNLTVGSYYFVVTAYDLSGNESDYSNEVVKSEQGTADTTKPTVSTFTIPTTATSLTVPISSFIATDNVAVTGFIVTESSTAPSATAAGWSATVPASYTATSAGAHTLYAYAKDAAGNVSTGKNASVTITITTSDTTKPTVNTFTIPATATSLTVPISNFTATDNVAVTGFIVTESSSAPSATAAGWSATVPTSYTATSAGAHTLYAYAKDAAGNVSTGKSASVTITITTSDTTKPTVNTFTIPATATSLTVPISNFTATDNVAVTGFIVTESSSAPSATAAGWSATVPTSYTATSAGAHTLYAYAKDAAGNVSTGKSANVTINIASSNTTSSIGVFRNGMWYLDTNATNTWNASADTTVSFGMAGDIPVLGDWNGSGTTKIGVFRKGVWYLDTSGSNTWNAGVDTAVSFGMAGDIPVVGDWNGSGTTKIGVFRNGMWYLDTNGNNAWNPGVDAAVSFGMPGDIPVVGDWNGSGTTKIGVFRNGIWYLDTNGNNVWNPGVDAAVSFGMAGDIPVVGDWNGSGTTKIGVFRNGVWYLDMNGNNKWDAGIDAVVSFGMAGDKPIVK